MMADYIKREDALKAAKKYSDLPILWNTIEYSIPSVDIPQWISVEERLPKSRDWVLVWHTGYKTPKKAKYLYECCKEFVFDGGGGVWDIDGWKDLEGVVTHWMPLPEPPKEETDG